jgi:hypothetical protein
LYNSSTISADTNIDLTPALGGKTLVTPGSFYLFKVQNNSIYAARITATSLYFYIAIPTSCIGSGIFALN